MVVLALKGLVFVIGLVLLITGKVKVSSRREIRGWPARIMGILLMLSVPLSYLVVIIVAAVMIVGGSGAAELERGLMLPMLDIFTVIGTAVLVAILGNALGTKPAPPPGTKPFVFAPPGEVRPEFVLPSDPPGAGSPPPNR